MKISVMLFLSVFLSAAALAQGENPFPGRELVQKAMQEVYLDMARGEPPVLNGETAYYQGLCLTPMSAAVQPPLYSALVALSGSPEQGYRIAYTTRTGGNTPDYTSADYSKLEKLYSVREKPFELVDTEQGGRYVKFTIAEATPTFPKIVSGLSMDKSNPDRLYFIAILMGFYCRLDRVR